MLPFRTERNRIPLCNGSFKSDARQLTTTEECITGNARYAIGNRDARQAPIRLTPSASLAASELFAMRV